MVAAEAVRSLIAAELPDLIRIRRDLHAQRRRIRLPAEPTDDARLLRRIPHDVELTGDAIAVRIVGISSAQQVDFADRLEQAQPDHLLGHARADAKELASLLEHKCRLLAGPAVDDVDALVARFTDVAKKSHQEIASIYDFKIRDLAE